VSVSNIENLSELIKTKLAGMQISLSVEFDHLVLTINKKDHQVIFSALKNDQDLGFNYLVSITAIDWLDKKDLRFEVVYHLMNLKTLYRLRVKVAVPEEDPTIDTVLPHWAAADYLESETWDMYGINFRGNPDVRRMLMYPEFEGHPLRKDYPVQGKQPRVPMRYPEVRNTALDMIRSPLVQITNKKKLESRA